jgi:hypothetical protein
VSDAYIEMVLARHVYQPPPLVQFVTNLITSGISQWAGNNLLDISFVGSVAKRTAISGTTDLDLFISLHEETPHTLQDIYERLVRKAQAQTWIPGTQNVSVGINFLGAKKDLVPGRRQPGFTYYHWLWKRKQGTRQQTAPTIHIRDVRDSGRTREIRAIKIWRKNHGLDFPSFYLELTVMKALSGCGYNLADNVQRALGYIADNLPTAAVEDPANTNNTISDDLTLSEKRVIGGPGTPFVR